MSAILELKMRVVERNPAGPALCLVASFWLVVGTGSPARGVQPERARGPLRVDAANPRYFSDPDRKPVFLTGSHTWGNLQDYHYESRPSPSPMDFGAYLRFLARHHHNFFRLWAWETAINRGAQQGTIYYEPLPYARSGQAKALDGRPRFDLTRFDQAYFERMRARITAAGAQGIYVSVMLFNGFSVEGKGNVGGDPWFGHPLNPRNNLNGIDGGSGPTTHTLSNPAVTAVQENYVRKVIDTVNDLDNVLYEVSNEDTASAADTQWQFHFIRFIKSCESSKPKQHPVGMTATWPGTDEVLYHSPADWVSPAAKVPLGDGRKVILNDTDHSYFWIGLKKDGPAAQCLWVWENLAQGNQCLFMDPYLDPSHDRGRNTPSGDHPDRYWENLRRAMGEAREYAERMDLQRAVPHGELASSHFCLANPGKQYLAVLPQGGQVTLDLSAVRGTLNSEWVRTLDGSVQKAVPVRGGEKITLSSPLPEGMVVYLWSEPPSSPKPNSP